MEKMIFQSLLDNFGVPLVVYPRQEKGGEFINGEWVIKQVDEASKVEVNEPFIPSSLMTQMPQTSAYTAARFEKYEMIWFSSQVLPLKSKVVHKGVTYSVEDAIPYTDYSDVTQYGCKAVSISVK
ncbi:hypothetical protein B2M95_07390 [Listeria monocytogenes]|nr:MULTISPECIES: hypothetical protein [Listeria]EAC9467710.1 hypothetical protein [Listeria monocytogenes]EAD0460542.1 hypothetical protein [Listeria monocytogenes]EAD6997218.1 hypothetical protein [Listeria monocytogenes]EAD9986453.1 hypothetical protein [Listeria monocytogenes]EAE4847965.1 hypothetical protein [Listeria monocytogenes]